MCTSTRDEAHGYVRSAFVWPLMGYSQTPLPSRRCSSDMPVVSGVCGGRPLRRVYTHLYLPFIKYTIHAEEARKINFITVL